MQVISLLLIFYQPTRQAESKPLSVRAESRTKNLNLYYMIILKQKSGEFIELGIGTT